MNQQEYDRQMDECAKDGMGGGETLGHMNIMEGRYAPIRKPMWCDNEEQKKYRVGQCCDNVLKKCFNFAEYLRKCFYFPYSSRVWCFFCAVFVWSVVFFSIGYEGFA